MTPVGMTTLVPIEVLFAAGYQPLDMNNVFVADARSREFIDGAERAGFPDTSCAWLKGIYGAMLARPDIETIVGVTAGDCSDTHVLMEYVERLGRRVIPFAYVRERLGEEIEALMRHFDVSWEQVTKAHGRLQGIRRRVWQIDEWTWRPESRVSGWDNHLCQVCCSDMGGDIEAFEQEVREYEPANEPINSAGVRLGVLGVPSIFAEDMYRYVETECGAKVVFNETQRQFSLPFDCDIVEQYTRFTYPYGTRARLADIQAEVERRDMDGLIHYTQAFCFRELTDALIRQDVDVPVLTIAGNTEKHLSTQLKTRLEAFVDMLERRRAAAGSST
ncbi:MAG: 2-hydroxyacyl-CoA dehydratase [Armatimonadota bacterium]|jgi:benzoyl-CoA reductase/2-hydroxyglutaryl-CoA dehydratase subunit BcrC/BadD/HgdB